MGKVRELIDDLDPEGSPADHARFLRLFYRVTLVLFVIWALGQFKYFGFPGFARANEVDEKVQAAIEPLRAEIGKVVKAQGDQDEVLKSIRIDQLESKLRELQIIKCRIVESDTDRLDTEIEVAQRAHRALTGERYALPPCKGVP